MKKSKFSKPKLPEAAKRVRLPRRRDQEQKVQEALSSVPRITNDNVTEHREEVLSSARKYIYPLQHSKHRVIRISVALFSVVLLFFFAYIGLALYRFQSTSTFVYGVTKVIPLPVAKAGDSWISYESYLFELRRNMHYYGTQQRTDFASKDGQAQLKHLKKQAMNQVIKDAYVKQLAEKHDVRVTGRMIDSQVALVRSQNRLGSNDRVFKDVLNQYWGWTEADFERALRQQLLQQAVVNKLDTQTRQRAEEALRQLKGGADFAALAGQLSDDQATRGNGGQYPNPIARNERDVAPQITAELMKLEQGQISDIVNSGYSLEILKVTEKSGNTIRGAHIQFNMSDIESYIAPLRKSEPVKRYIQV